MINGDICGLDNDAVVIDTEMYRAVDHTLARDNKEDGGNDEEIGSGKHEQKNYRETIRISSRRLFLL